jgi:hypothetical protein
MAVSALPRTRPHTQQQSGSIGPLVLGVTLVTPGLDLLAVVLPGLQVITLLSLVASSVATAVLVLSWLRFPRTSWLAAAMLASVAGLATRVVGLELGPLLAVLTVLALGVGGAFASAPRDVEAWSV